MAADEAGDGAPRDFGFLLLWCTWQASLNRALAQQRSSFKPWNSSTGSQAWSLGLSLILRLQMKLETERQEAAVHATMEEDEQAHGKVTRTISSVRLLVDAARADEQVSGSRNKTTTIQPCYTLNR